MVDNVVGWFDINSGRFKGKRVTVIGKQLCTINIVRNILSMYSKTAIMIRLIPRLIIKTNLIYFRIIRE
jgi:hypothetical protein